MELTSPVIELIADHIGGEKYTWNVRASNVELGAVCARADV